MATGPHVDLATYLNTNVGAFTLGTNGFHGPVRTPDNGFPVEAAFLWKTAGPAAEPLTGGTRLVRHHVRVRVRGDKNDFDEGQGWADTVHAACEHADVTGYINCRNLEANPNYIGSDDADNHEWQWTVELIKEE